MGQGSGNLVVGAGVVVGFVSRNDLSFLLVETMRRTCKSTIVLYCAALHSMPLGRLAAAMIPAT